MLGIASFGIFEWPQFFDGFQESCKIAGSKQSSLLEYWPCSRRRPYSKCAYHCLAKTGIRIEHHHSSIKPDVRTSKEMKNQQTDSRGGSRGRVQGCAPPPPPEMTCGFLIQLVFCKKKPVWFIGVSYAIP